MRHRGFASSSALFIVLSLAFSVLLTACGGDAPTPTAAPAIATPTATGILQMASRRLAETTSVHYELRIEGDTFLEQTGSIKLLDATGDLLRPDRVYSSFRVSVFGRVVTLQLITVGGDSWTTDLVTGEWVESPLEFAYNPSVLFDVDRGIGPVMDRVSAAERGPDDELNGRPVYRIVAQVDQPTIGPLTSNLMTAPAVTVELWIDRETNDLLRAELRQPESDEIPLMTWTLDLSKHDQDVSIEPPL